MKKKLLLLILAGLVLVTGACKKKVDDEPTIDDYIELSNYYKGLYEASESKLNGLEQALKVYEITDEQLKKLKESVILPDGSKKFLSINGLIDLGGHLNIGPYNRVPNQAYVFINDTVAIKPTKNWIMQYTEDGLIMEHTSGLYADIQSYKYAGTDDGVSCYSNILVPYVNELGFSDFDVRVLFLGDYRAGYTTELNIKVDNTSDEDGELEDYIYNVGITIAEGKITVYKFLYKQTDSSSAIKELVNNTISSIRIGGLGLSIE